MSEPRSEPRTSRVYVDINIENIIISLYIVEGNFIGTFDVRSVCKISIYVNNM